MIVISLWINQFCSLKGFSFVAAIGSVDFFIFYLLESHKHSTYKHYTSSDCIVLFVCKILMQLRLQCLHTVIICCSKYKLYTVILITCPVLHTFLFLASSEWQHFAWPDSNVEPPAFQCPDHAHPAQPSGTQDSCHHRHAEGRGPGDCCQPGNW